jgi:hypothetical protein
MSTKESLTELVIGLMRFRDWEYRRLVEEDLSNPYWMICLDRALTQLNIAISEMDNDKASAELQALREVTEAAKVFDENIR